MSQTLEQLRALSDDELVRGHDKLAPSFTAVPQHYLDELNRRYQERQTESMLRFTKWITVMTVVITSATVINLGIAIGMLVVMVQD